MQRRSGFERTGIASGHRRPHRMVRAPDFPCYAGTGLDGSRQCRILVGMRGIPAPTRGVLAPRRRLGMGTRRDETPEEDLSRNPDPELLTFALTRGSFRRR